MFADRKQFGRDVDDRALVLNGFDRRAGCYPTHHRHRDRTAAVVLRTLSHAPEIALNDTRREAA
jgi:hypothetical protein